MDGNELALIKQELKNYKDTTNNIIHQLSTNIKELDERVKTMEVSKEKTEYQYSQIMDSLKTLNETTIPNLTQQIQELKNKPAKRYEQAVSGIIGSIFGAIGGIIAGIFLKS